MIDQIINNLPYITFLTFLILASGLVYISVRFTNNLTARSFVLLIYLTLLPLLYVGVTELLGRDKPASLELLKSGEEEATLLWHGANKEQGKIYLILQLETTKQPRLYSIPYDEKKKKKLERESRKGEAAKQKVIIKNPFNEGFLIQGPRQVKPDGESYRKPLQNRDGIQYFDMDPDSDGKDF